jgi:hypothetical protein
VARRFAALCFTLLAFGCAPKESDERIMDAIEGRVVLPKGAEPLGRYSRYYANGAAGQVEVLYIIHDKNFVRDVRESCGRSKTDTMPCAPGGKIGLVDSDNRKWLTDFRQLPVAHGGGCGVVRFAYEPKSDRFSPLSCNGPY